jgi:TolB-like protein
MAAGIGAVVLLAILAAGTWRIPWPGNSQAVPRLSIVVLPFANLSGDAAQQYFADGITEDVTSDLSRIVDMFVISRNTAATYRKRPADTKKIGRELGVRYVLDGTVQRLGNRVQVTTELIDAESDAHLWATGFDREIGDLFALQDEITRQIAYRLGVELVTVEAAKPSDNPDAVDFILRGRAKTAVPPSRDNFAEMIGLFERALTLDPRSVEAKSYLVLALMGRVLNGMSDTAAVDIKRAEASSAKPWRLHPTTRMPTWRRGSCYGRRTGSRRPFPNMRPRLRPIATGWSLLPVSVG